jgi:Mlc titration factor MtfA (ptsG expression regulator)
MLPKFFNTHRRDKIKIRPFPSEWEAILDRRVPHLKRLCEADRNELHGHIQVFLEEKSFEGCGGLEITDEICVTIAAEACILLLHRDTDYYPRLASILVYPSHFFSTLGRRNSDGVISEEPRALLGESWTTGSLILSWQTIEADSGNDHDGHNVIFHEFAHQLDREDGAMSGAPGVGEGLPLGAKKQKFAHWAQVMQEEFDHLQFHQRHGHKTLIDQYGAESPSEFFAVSVETFFERPRQLQRQHPELYAELKDYFHQDPAAWKSG